jgi:carbon monoxide dehydrogenase subunit G
MEATMSSDRETQRDVRDEFDNAFDVPLPPDKAWPVLSDIQRVASCIPGVKLNDVVDEKTYQGSISVPLGPMPLTFASEVKVEEVDPVKRTARLAVQGTDANAPADAHGTFSFRLEPANGGSKVLVHTDLVLTGAAAQYGRLDIVQATAAQMLDQFAANLRAQFSGRPG